MNKYNYFIPESSIAFEAEWQPVEERLKKILPLKDESGEVVHEDTQVIGIDFKKVAEALTGEPDTTEMIKRFLEAVNKKDSYMTVKELLARPSGEITRWRRQGNRVALLPNALVLHMNSLAE